jgi:hypothetical protein
MFVRSMAMARLPQPNCVNAPLRQDQAALQTRRRENIITATRGAVTGRPTVDQEPTLRGAAPK